MCNGQRQIVQQGNGWEDGKMHDGKWQNWEYEIPHQTLPSRKDLKWSEVASAAKLLPKLENNLYYFYSKTAAYSYIRTILEGCVVLESKFYMFVWEMWQLHGGRESHCSFMVYDAVLQSGRWVQSFARTTISWRKWGGQECYSSPITYTSTSSPPL
jgi:hypothetical protein